MLDRKWNINSNTLINVNDILYSILKWHGPLWKPEISHSLDHHCDGQLTSFNVHMPYSKISNLLFSSIYQIHGKLRCFPSANPSEPADDWICCWFACFGSHSFRKDTAGIKAKASGKKLQCCLHRRLTQFSDLTFSAWNRMAQRLWVSVSFTLHQHSIGHSAEDGGLIGWV